MHFNKHRCAQTRRKEIVTTDVRCNHWPFTLLTIHPLFTVTTDRLTDHKYDSSFIPLHGEIIKKIWLVSLLPYTLSLLSDWIACAHTCSPCSLIGQSEWAHTALPALWLVSLNEHMLLCEWAHNHDEIQWKIKKATDRQTDRQTDRHTESLTSTVLSPPFSAGNNIAGQD